MLGFVERGKPENPEKNLQNKQPPSQGLFNGAPKPGKRPWERGCRTRREPTTNSTHILHQNRTRASLAGHCAIPAPTLVSPLNSSQYMSTTMRHRPCVCNVCPCQGTKIDIIHSLCGFLRFTGYNMTAESRDSPLTFHRVIEAFKFGFSWRSLLGDPAFNDNMNEVIERQERAETVFYQDVQTPRRELKIRRTAEYCLTNFKVFG